MGYKVFDASGNHVAGDAELDESVKGAALLVNGWVEDGRGQVVYESPRRREVLAEQQRIADEQAERQRAAAEDERDDEPESLTGVVTPPEEE